MKRTDYRSMLQFYLLFFLGFFVLSVIGAVLVFTTITVKGPDGNIRKSDWPQKVTEDFSGQLLFTQNKVQVHQKGIEFLQDEKIGLQVLDETGKEIYEYQKPSSAEERYLSAQLLDIIRTGQTEAGDTAFVETVSYGQRDYTYLLYFPMKIQKVGMYVNGERFSDGKTMALIFVGILLLVVLLIGTAYGIYMARTVRKMTAAIGSIAKRTYEPERAGGAFTNIYEGLNELDEEIRVGDRLREKTETMREEWIANITHDLKTPLSPVKGYAELLCEAPVDTEIPYRRYGEIIQKNVKHIEALLDDLKLTFKIDNEMVAVNRRKQDMVRFLKETVIDILNIPEYTERIIHFESNEPVILFPFDETLLRRAVDNLLLNSFVHGDENTEITLSVRQEAEMVKITVSDNGRGMSKEEMENLFERYYRGTNTGRRTQGTGLGLAIAKRIIELHEGIIHVESLRGEGTQFTIVFSN